MAIKMETTRRGYSIGFCRNTTPIMETQMRHEIETTILRDSIGTYRNAMESDENETEVTIHRNYIRTYVLQSIFPVDSLHM